MFPSCVCGEAASVPAERVTTTWGPVYVVRCVDCGLVRLSCLGTQSAADLLRPYADEFGIYRPPSTDDEFLGNCRGVSSLANGLVLVLAVNRSEYWTLARSPLLARRLRASVFIPQQHIWYFTTQTLSNLLGLAGFDSHGVSSYADCGDGATIRSRPGWPMARVMEKLDWGGGIEAFAVPQRSEGH